MASPQPSTSTSPPLSLRSSHNRFSVREAAARFEGGDSSSATESPQAGDIQQLKEAQRVAGLKGSFVSPPRASALARPAPRASFGRTVTPPSAARALNSSLSARTPPDSPATQLAAGLSKLSLSDTPPPARAQSSASGSSARGGQGTFREAHNTSPTASKGKARALSQDWLEESQEEQEELTPRIGGSEMFAVEAVDGQTDELRLLIVSSGMTELGMSIQDVGTLIFEIQELRHTTSTIPSDATPKPDPIASFQNRRPSDVGMHSSASNAPSKPSGSPTTSRSGGDGQSALSEVDQALIKLNGKLEEVGLQYADLDRQISPYLDGSAPVGGELAPQVASLGRKWSAVTREWQDTSRDADRLGEELKEDKWLVVFRTVSHQAEEMMRSLEKALAQSDAFILDFVQRQAKLEALSTSPSLSSLSLTSRSLSNTSSTSSLVDLHGHGSLDALLSSFQALHQSLNAKIKYYSPACERVLKILGKGINDRSTKNGEVLRRFGEMKARWAEIKGRIDRIEGDMDAAEAVLKEEVAKEKGSTGMTKSMSSASLSPGTARTDDSPSVGRISPFRRLANKVTRSSPTSVLKQPQSQPAGTPSTASGHGRPSPISTPTGLGLSTNSQPSPARPPRSALRQGTTPPVTRNNNIATPPPRTPTTQSRTLGHRRSASALNPSSNLAASARSDRSYSPAPSASSGYGAPKPRWNISTKRSDDKMETLRSSYGGSRPPISGTGWTPSRSQGLGGSSVSGRHSAMGIRPSSRMSNSGMLSRSVNSATGSHFGRPSSPTWSEASSAVHRQRPETPGSRIPMPSSASKSRIHDEEEDVRRGMTPTPTALSSSVRPSNGGSRPPSRASRLPTPSRPSSRATNRLSYSKGPDGGLSPPQPRRASPTPSSTSSAWNGHASHGWRGAPTPEPSLAAHAKRMSYVRASSARAPPMPSVPSGWRSGAATPTASSVGGRALSRSGFHGPGTPSGHASHGTMVDGVYQPNPTDPLDVAFAAVVNALPLQLAVYRVDAHFTRAQLDSMESFSARYSLALGDEYIGARKPVMCKLVDRLGPKRPGELTSTKGPKEKKVVVRVGSGMGAGWVDLESHCLELMASGVRAGLGQHE